jgi:hypothetical protein
MASEHHFVKRLASVARMANVALSQPEASSPQLAIMDTGLNGHNRQAPATVVPRFFRANTDSQVSTTVVIMVP